jgi:hypothetical protein
LIDASLLSPDSERCGTGAPIACCGHELTTWSEVAEDHCMRGEEALRLARRLEALHLPLSSASGSMRILGSIIQVPAGPMRDVRKYRSVSDSIAAQTVRDEAPWLVFQPV